MESVRGVKDLPIKKENSNPHPKLEDFKHTLFLLLKNKLAFGGLVVTIIYFLIALLDAAYPQWLGYTSVATIFDFVSGPVNASTPLMAPTTTLGWQYWFGTTQYGVPLFPVILAALKFDLSESLLIVVIGAGIGTLIGSISGYFGGYLDEVLMRVTDIFFSIPFLVLALAIAAILGPGITNITIALVVVWWPIYARLGRSQALTLKSQRFVEASTAMGSSGFRNVFVHVIPNLLSPMFIQFSLDLGAVIQIFAALQFININTGIQNIPEIGSLISMGQNYLPIGDWWAIVIPGIFLLIFTLAVNVFGDGLRDVLDPKLRR